MVAWTGWRKFAVGFAGAYAAAQWGLFAAGVHSELSLPCAVIATVLTVDSVLGFPLWFLFFGQVDRHRR